MSNFRILEHGMQTEKFYNKFSFFYPLIDVFLRPQKRVLFRKINAMPFGYLLEIGVGNGEHLPLYKSHRVAAIDTSAKMLEHAAVYKQSNTELMQMSGESLSFAAESFDYIVLSHVIAVVHDPEQLLAEVYRVLKPGGKVFILNHFTPNNYLRFADRAFQKFSKLFHFRSVFHIESLKNISRFRLAEQISFGRLSYFKLLIYLKAE